MSKKLDEIRGKIDSIDNQVHDLLMERASLVSDIAAEKKKNKLQTVQPAREAMMLRRLLARHKGPLPEATVVHIWRELVGAVSLLQTGLNVIVTADKENAPYWDMARNYFGSVVPMKKTASPLAAIGAVRDGSTSFAVLPWPEDTNDNPWWSHILSAEGERMRVICCLPFGSEENPPHERALVIARLDFKSSGDDHSFVTLELDQSVSRARIIEVFKKFDLEPLSLYTRKASEDRPFSQHLVEVKAFIEDDSEILAKIRQEFGEQCSYCVALGGYPALPVFKTSIKKQNQSIPAAPKESADKRESKKAS